MLGGLAMAMGAVEYLATLAAAVIARQSCGSSDDRTSSPTSTYPIGLASTRTVRNAETYVEEDYGVQHVKPVGFSFCLHVRQPAPRS